MGHHALKQLVVTGLGRAEIQLGSLVLAPDQEMLFPLALVLAQRAGERISRTELVDLLWPDTGELAGRHSLRQGLYRLRKAGLAMDDRTEELRVDPAFVTSDLTRALRHDWPFVAEPDEITRAAQVLPGIDAADGTRLAEWLEALRGRLAAQFRAATLHRIEMARREGRWREVDLWALECLRADPLNEEATLARAEASAMVGAKNAALDILDAYLRELGERAKVIGLPARMLRRRISELTDTTGRRVTATSAPFIGRHEEMAIGHDTLQRARGGEVAIQWFTGPPGIGKSRLLRELARSGRMAGWCVVAGGARPSYEDRPFALLTELLPQLLDAPGALGADPEALTLMRQMGRADTGEEPLAPEEARVRQYAVYLAFVELMEAVLGEAPLAIIADDTHWADPTTLLMFARFIEGHPSARLAVILSARKVPTRDDESAQRLLGASQRRVAPLSEAEMREFARAAGLREEEAEGEVTHRLGEVAGGNPLFLGHLLHQHQTQREPQVTPPDLATLIDGQLRLLSREALRLLQACALLGRHATLPRVERMLGVQAPSLVTPFADLDDMLAIPSEPGQSLAPHDLWTERVRHGMTAGVFRTMAVSAARVLEADAQSDGGIEIYWDAARLYQESGEKQLAYAVMMRCAEYLSNSGATPESCRAFATAAEYASHPRDRYDALSGQLQGLHAMGEFASAQVVVDEIRTLCVEHPEHSLSPEQEVQALETAHFSGSTDDMQASLRKVIANRSLSAEVRLYATRLGLVGADNFHDEGARAYYSQALAQLPDGPQSRPNRLRAEIVDLTLRRKFSAAIDMCQQLLLETRALRNRPALMFDLRFCSAPSRRGNDLPGAILLLDEARDLARRFKYPYGHFRATDMMAGLFLDYGRLQDAQETLIAAEALLVDSLGSFVRESLNLTWAFWALAAGDLAEARERASRVPALNQQSRSRHAMLSAALRLELAVADSKEAELKVMLTHLLESNGELFLFGGSDQIATAVYRGLAFLGRTTEARSFAQNYVRNQRPELFPPPQILLDC